MAAMIPPRGPFSTMRAALVALVLAWPVAPGAGDGQLGAHAPLDGLHFVGRLGPEGQAADRDDTLYFADGQFWSENCVPCGFAPGPYWTRHAEDSIHFRGELHSPESGTFSYQGVVQDGRLQATIHWRKERWYWTIRRDFHIEGTLEETPTAALPSAASVALLAASEARVCEP